jgi:hypothetical protein
MKRAFIMNSFKGCSSAIVNVDRRSTEDEKKLKRAMACHPRLMIQLVRTRSILCDAASLPLDSFVGHAIHGSRDSLETPNLFSHYLGR